MTRQTDIAEVAALREWQDAEANAARLRGEKLFMNKPDVWYQSPHWFCINGHVSHRFLKCEEDGDCCLACLKGVILGPPMSEADFGPIAAHIRHHLQKDPTK